MKICIKCKVNPVQDEASKYWNKNACCKPCAYAMYRARWDAYGKAASEAKRRAAGEKPKAVPTYNAEGVRLCTKCGINPVAYPDKEGTRYSMKCLSCINTRKLAWRKEIKLTEDGQPVYKDGMKYCPACKQHLPMTAFASRSGGWVCHHKHCKKCNAESKRLLHRYAYYRSLYSNKRNEYKERQRLGRRGYYQRSVIAKLRSVLRSRIRAAIKVSTGTDKAYKTIELIGCNTLEFRRYLEAQFKPGMTWDNLGNTPGTWQIHHIVACSKFDLTRPEEQKRCFHYSNTKPLWWAEHMDMHDRERRKDPVE